MENFSIESERKQIHRYGISKNNSSNLDERSKATSPLGMSSSKEVILPMVIDDQNFSPGNTV